MYFSFFGILQRIYFVRGFLGGVFPESISWNRFYEGGSRRDGNFPEENFPSHFFIFYVSPPSFNSKIKNNINKKQYKQNKIYNNVTG